MIYDHSPQELHSHIILWTGSGGGGGGGGLTEVHILYPRNPQIQKIPTFLHTPPPPKKNPTLAVNCAHVIVDLTWLKYTTQKFSRPQKIPASFIDPKSFPFAATAYIWCSIILHIKLSSIFFTPWAFLKMLHSSSQQAVSLGHARDRPLSNKEQ